MRRRTALSRPQRRRIFLGCEGESEQSYGTLVNSLAREAGYSVHIDTIVLKPTSGDPLTIVRQAIDACECGAAKRGEYFGRFLLLDGDTRGFDRNKDRQAEVEANKVRIVLIWQEPCHEAFLLRHLDGCAALRPPTSRDALNELIRRWPDYNKALPAIRLAERIDEGALERAAAAERGLKLFLQTIGFASRGGSAE